MVPDQTPAECPVCGCKIDPASFLEEHLRQIHYSGWLAKRQGSVDGLPAVDGLPEVTEAPAIIEAESAFRQLETEIDELLCRRGFEVGAQHPDCTIWKPNSVFWEEQEMFSWCMAYFGGGAIWFGVSPDFIQAALMHTSNSGGELGRLWKQARGGLPKSVRQLEKTFTRQGRLYFGFRLGAGVGIDQVRELIVELVNAFVVYATGGKPWGSRSTVGGAAEPGVPCLQTAPMPNPKSTPHHSLALMSKDIFKELGKKYKQSDERGSVSWRDLQRNIVVLKLCYFGPRSWLFGVNRSIVNANPCLDRVGYNYTFHIKPVTFANKTVYRGFQVFDTPASCTRIRDVLNCL